MSGIERLRAIAGAWDEWGLGGTLAEIADEIERELVRHDEPDSTDKGARLPYVTEMEHIIQPEPKRICGDCRHWQGDPSASHMGVCFNSYRERCCVDSYAAQLDYAKACEDFEERGE